MSTKLFCMAFTTPHNVFSANIDFDCGDWCLCYCIVVLNVLKTTFTAEDNSYRELRCEIMWLKYFIVKSDLFWPRIKSVVLSGVQIIVDSNICLVLPVFAWKFFFRPSLFFFNQVCTLSFVFLQILMCGSLKFLS